MRGFQAQVLLQKLSEGMKISRWYSCNANNFKTVRQLNTVDTCM